MILPFITLFSLGFVAGMLLFYYLMREQAKQYDEEIEAYERLVKAQNDLLEQCIERNNLKTVLN